MGEHSCSFEALNLSDVAEAPNRVHGSACDFQAGKQDEDRDLSGCRMAGGVGHKSGDLILVLSFLPSFLDVT